jgi:translation initiation factor 1
MAARNSRTVYSTDPDWKPEEDRPTEENVRQGTVYIRRETKGRGGKTVTVISGLVGNLKSWKKDLQKLCGSGGTVKEGNIEIQGDHRSKIAEYLQGRGLKTKFSGG